MGPSVFGGGARRAIVPRSAPLFLEAVLAELLCRDGPIGFWRWCSPSYRAAMGPSVFGVGARRAIVPQWAPMCLELVLAEL